jgi:lipoprotein-anchoring transpeptidase ErfK/SrfK
MKIRSQPAVTTRFPRATPTHAINAIGGATAAALCAVAALALTGVLAAQPAAAQQGFGNFFTYQQPKPRKRVVRKPSREPAAPQTAQSPEAAAAAKPEAPKPAEKSGPQGTVYAIVSLPDQHITVYDANGVIARSRVSTGQAGYRTPIGVFSVIGKSRYHRSNIYSGAPMPWMQRITWSGVAMHAGVVPGYPASHGCIRLPYSFAPQMFALTKMGARVVVASRDTAPVEFSHPLLPAPKMQLAPTTQQQAARADASVELASMETTSTMTTAAVGDDATNKAAVKLLDPIAYAGALKERALADKAVADAAAKEALAAAQAAGAEARQAVEDVRKGEADLKAAEARIAALEARAAAPAPAPAAAAAPGTPDPAAALEAEKTAAQSELARARAALEEARAREAAKTPAAFAAVDSWKRTVSAADAAAKLVEEADRRRAQVSVFISRKEGRIFIRQNWKEVWEAPVTIRDPDRPLGTHIYTAVDTAPDGSAVKWTAITIPAEQAPPKDAKGERTADRKERPEAPAAKPETAAGALDRIELPEGARERIAELLWTGGSLIVSDNPRSYEMGEYTDFIVLTR